ncbi:dihydrofolate reductase family protein, partial [Buchnera aphidicola]|nr:dihydrofolate reductase family protein [Buchnera aphidicola]
MSIDGKIALKNGKSKWITSEYSRQDVQKFRAKSSAILSTSSTILADDSLLNVRIHELKKNLS